MKITIEDGTLTMEPALTVGDLSDVLLSALFGLFQKVLADTPSQEQPPMRKALFDMFNVAASEFLKQLDPEAELHPELTERAIMEMEDQILEREMSKMQERDDKGDSNS